LTEEDLFEAVLASPDADGPRLRLAEWWTERGDLRGTFVSVQIRLQDPGLDPEERKLLLVRETLLLGSHQDQWLAPLGLLLGEGSFVRGFVETLQLTPQRLVQVAPRLGLAAPIRSLRVYGQLGEEPLAEALGHLPSLRSLELRRLGVRPHQVFALAEQPSLQSLVSLDLGENHVRDGCTCALASSPHLGQLMRLELDWNQIGVPGAAALVSSPHLQQLEYLDLSGNPLGLGGAFALAHEPLAPRLARLVLGTTQLGAEGARTLSRYPHLHKRVHIGLKDDRPRYRSYPQRPRWISLDD
jgi:uncharacterized protein (TIGR02996 family)